MGRFDNPSAGKFDPPPGGERFEAPRPERRGVWVVGALGVAIALLREYERWRHPRGVWAAVGALGITALWVLQFVVRRRTRPDDDNPYSDETHVTR